MPNINSSPKKMTRSSRLKRYESVYTKALKQGGTGTASHKKLQKSIRRTSNYNKDTKDFVTYNNKVSSKKRSKKLTTYQKFVKVESKKTRYKDMAPRDRLSAIGAAWNTRKMEKK